MAITDGVVALEIEETRRTAHGADRSNEGISFAGVVEGAGSGSMHTYIDPQSPNDAAWLLGVRKRLVLRGSVHELVLARRAGVMAPKPLKIDGANVTSSALKSKKPVDLLEVLESGLVVEVVAAAEPSRSNIVFTGRKNS